MADSRGIGYFKTATFSRLSGRYQFEATVFKVLKVQCPVGKTSGFRIVLTLKICWTLRPDVMSGRALYYIVPSPSTALISAEKRLITCHKQSMLGC